jgi:hypothetical protein
MSRNEIKISARKLPVVNTDSRQQRWGKFDASACYYNTFDEMVERLVAIVDN